MNRSIPPPPGDLSPYQQADQPIPYTVYAEDPEDLNLDLRSVWSFIARNKWLILALTFLGLAAAFAYNRMATPVYQATTTLRILDADRGGSGTKQLDMTLFQSGTGVETEMAVLKSRAVAEQVVDSLNLQIRLLSPEEASRDSVFSALSVSDEPAVGTYRLIRDEPGRITIEREGHEVATVRPGEEVAFGGIALIPTRDMGGYDEVRFQVLSKRAAATQVQSNLTVTQPSREENIIVIRYEGSDPELVARVSNALSSSFLAFRRAEQKSSASSTVEFLRAQIDTISSQLRLAEEDLRDFREEEQVVNLAAEGQSQIGQMASLQSQRDALQAENASLRNILREIESTEREDPFDPSAARRLLGTPAILRNQAATQMLNTIIQLENERAELLERRTPQDPDVQALTNRIHGVEEQLHSVASNYQQSLASQVQSLESSIGRAGSELREIPSKEVEFGRRQREAMLLQETYTLLQTKLKEAEIAQAVEDANARIVDTALVPTSPIRPNKGRNLLLAGLLGLMLGVGAAFGREYLDDTVHTMDDLEELTGVPVLGMIPRIPHAQLDNGNRRLLSRGGNGRTTPDGRETPHSSRLVVDKDSKHAVSEAFRSLRTNITFSSAERIPKILLLTSATAEDGKSTSATNLTAAFAQQGLSAILVDADLRRGLLHKIFGLSKTPGLSNFLVENLSVPDVIQRVEVQGSVPIDVITAGRYPPNPAELLGSKRMESLLGVLSERYDVVVVDTPPLTMVTDAAVLSTWVDTVMLVARAGKTEEAAIEFAMKQLRNVQAPLKGTILNDVTSTNRRYGSYGYYAYQYEYYGAEEESA